MAWHVTFREKQQSAKLGGWGENFWNTNVSLAAAQAAANSLQDILINCKGAQLSITGYRLSQVGAFRVTQNITRVLGPFAPSPSAYPDADYPSTALQLKLRGTTTNKVTTQWLRGLPDSITTTGGLYTPGGSSLWQAYFNQLCAKLTGGSWAVYVLNPLTPYFPVTLNNTITGSVTIKGNNYGALGATAYVRIKGMGQQHPMNGLFTFTVTDPTTGAGTISPWTPTTTNLPFWGKRPTAQAQVYMFDTIAEATNGITTSHYTGKPTGLLGGRRRKRKIISV